jgi:hypothetical protein
MPDSDQQLKSVQREELNAAERQHVVNMEHWKAQNVTDLEQFKANIQQGVAGFNATVSFAMAGLRGLFLLNGGGAIGSLTLVGNLLIKTPPSITIVSKLSSTMCWFVCGLATAILATFLAYLTQDQFANLMASGARKSTYSATILKYSTIFVSATSLVCFFIGAILGAAAVKVTP